MNLQSRIAKLEAATPTTSAPWLRCIVNPVETLDDVIARDFGGVRPENLIVRTIITPEPRP